jgi:peptidoglycan hydrolase-like protein with peptidoglycan-binding domain
VSTGRKIDTVFIGQSSQGRASTLVGDDLAKDYSESGLGQAEVTVAAGTQITMELAEALELPAATRSAADPRVRHIRVAQAWVAAAQHALTERNYYHGPIDGQLGPITGATRQAIIRFQLDQRQLATGDLDEETLRLLDVKTPANR